MKKTKSFLRREEYVWLGNRVIDGKVLDIGGSKKSGYHELIQGKHTFVVGNIDEAYDIDVVFDAQKQWPVTDDEYDGVLFINVLEHLYDYRTALSESIRALAPGGILLGVVPFMFNVHGSPSDYYRYTRFALERMLTDAGYSSIEIDELGTGAFSVIYQCLIGFVRWNWLASVIIPIFAGMDRLVKLLKPNNRLSAAYMPLGYAFAAKKPE